MVAAGALRPGACPGEVEVDSGCLRSVVPSDPTAPAGAHGEMLCVLALRSGQGAPRDTRPGGSNGAQAQQQQLQQHDGERTPGRSPAPGAGSGNAGRGQLAQHLLGFVYQQPPTTRVRAAFAFAHAPRAPLSAALRSWLLLHAMPTITNGGVQGGGSSAGRGGAGGGGRGGRRAGSAAHHHQHSSSAAKLTFDRNKFLQVSSSPAALKHATTAREEQRGRVPECAAPLDPAGFALLPLPLASGTKGSAS